MVDGQPAVRDLVERVAPNVQHRVSADEGVAQRSGLLGIEPLGLAAVAGRGQIEVAGDSKQFACGDRRPRALAAVGDVGLQRSEIAAAVEDDGDRFGHRQGLDT